MGSTARIGAVLAVVALAGCGQSRLNPLTWFGPSSEERIDTARATAGFPVVEQVVSLEASPTPSGLIVSTVGLPTTQGFWEAELVRVPSPDPSVLVMDFRILPPVAPQPAGTQPSREVVAGRMLTRQDLAGIRTIVVQGRANRRSIGSN
ncbi:hypothetical protein [Jannaschia rubra]|uniref:hypothetical protein n=1 Tax=Jannaschia rubra TaxID=282197 RepID=UPI0024907E4F|nr:hypothetical protein [Jannaschia rubra]